MKKLFLFAGAALLFAASGNAQVRRHTSPSQTVQSDSTHHKKGKMMDNLNLSADQKAQMKELHQNGKQQREAIKNDASLTPEQKKEKMKELHNTQSENMNKILTPDQQKTWKTEKAKMKKHKKMQGMKGKSKTESQGS